MPRSRFFHPPSAFGQRLIVAGPEECLLCLESCLRNAFYVLNLGRSRRLQSSRPRVMGRLLVNQPTAFRLRLIAAAPEECPLYLESQLEG
ncbi:hypothetical protein ACH5RR_024858 [Cinchona calisaya]|uniref:Uncharacterized protein n=1 Tax=Cinchona calisaya TaxID=153742 RepID=A0ABD2Z000_9GENT